MWRGTHGVLSGGDHGEDEEEDKDDREVDRGRRRMIVSLGRVSAE